MESGEDTGPGGPRTTAWRVAERTPAEPAPSAGPTTAPAAGDGSHSARPRHNRTLLRLGVGFLLVPVSSLLGLARPARETDASIYVDVWAANFWGDLVFTGGTMLSFLLCHAVVQWAVRHEDANVRPLGIAAVPLAFLMTWAVYAASWSLTGPAFDDSAIRFFALEPAGQATWGFVWEWGLPGIIGMAVLQPLAAYAMTAAQRSRPAPNP